MCSGFSCVVMSICAVGSLSVLLVVQLAGADEKLDAPVASARPLTGRQTEKPKLAEKRTHRTEIIRGRVVWLAKALKSEFGVSTVPEVAENTLAIHTADGRLIPIVENLRGRAFRKDKRLRNHDMEIQVRRYDAQPMILILRVFELDGDERYEIDYWCDVCAIVMFETGPCSCCQDDNRLRKRLVDLK